MVKAELPEPAVAAMVIWPSVEVVKVMLEPAIKFTTPQPPEVWAPSNWPARVGLDVVAVPPLAMGKTPVTSPVKEMRPIFKSPDTVLTTPVPKALMVVLPFAPTVNRAVLEEEATLKISKVGAEEVPCTTRRAVGVVEPRPTLELAVTRRMDSPMEVATLKGSNVPEPWTFKLIVPEEAFTPKTVPLSMSAPWAKAEAEVHLEA